MSSFRALQAIRGVSRLSRTISTSSRTMRFVAPSTLPRAVPSLLSRTFSVSTRAFAAPTEVKAEKTLLQKLEDELNHEKEILTDDKLPVPEFVEEFLKPGVWKIEEKPGQDEVVITRTFGNETIRVMFTISDVENAEPTFDEDAESDDEESLSGIFPIRTSISITKPTGGALSIEALAQDGIFSIETVSFYKDGKLANDLTADADYKRRGTYVGPQFENLDITLQEGFESFLAERGIGEELALVIPEYAEWKEQKEYIDWLKGVKGFVAA